MGMETAQSASIMLGAVVVLLGGVILALGPTVTIAEQEFRCASVVQAWVDPPDRATSDLGRVRQGLCDQRRETNRVLGLFVVAAGSGLAVLGWFVFGGTLSSTGGRPEPEQGQAPPSTSGEDPPATDAEPPADQRPPPGYWWDGQKWNPPAT